MSANRPAAECHLWICALSPLGNSAAYVAASRRLRWIRPGCHCASADADREMAEARLVRRGCGGYGPAHASGKGVFIDSPSRARFGLHCLNSAWELGGFSHARGPVGGVVSVLRQFAQVGNVTPGGADLVLKQARADGDADVGDGRRGAGGDDAMRITGWICQQGDEDVAAYRSAWLDQVGIAKSGRIPRSGSDRPGAQRYSGLHRQAIATFIGQDIHLRCLATAARGAMAATPAVHAGQVAKIWYWRSLLRADTSLLSSFG